MGLLLLPLPKKFFQNPFIFSLISIILLFLRHSAKGNSTPNTTVQTVLCNGQTYTKGDPFATSLAYVLAELEDVTPTRPGYDFYNISPYPNAFAYGHATCNQTLTPPDCATCLSVAKTAMLGTCDGHVGARSLLYDCSVRYEQYPFRE